MDKISWKNIPQIAVNIMLKIILSTVEAAMLFLIPISSFAP